MDAVTRKLQYKENFRCLILNNPDEFDWTFAYDRKRAGQPYDWELLFVNSGDELAAFLPGFLEAPDDRLRWIAYPKKSGSKASDISRDSIWKDLKSRDFQPVSMISLDNDWSVMRIRHNNFVRSRKPEKNGMPGELKELLADNPACNDFFRSLSRTNQKEYMQWIGSAKRRETLKRRLAKTKTLLQDHIPNPFTGR